VTPNLAKRELDDIARLPLPEMPRPPIVSLENGLIANELQADMARDVKPALVAVIGAVLLVLIIAGVNVTNLLLARGAERRPEFALRLTLGAGRGRLVRQVITESLVVAVIGGALGVGVAELGVRVLVTLGPAELPRLDAMSVNGTVLAFAFGVSTLVGVVIGLIPALFSSRGDLTIGLRHASRRATGGHQSTRRALVVAEVALALVLLVATGLLFRSLERLFAISPGFDASHVLTMQVQAASLRRYPNQASLRRFFASALEAVEHVPGVERAAWTSQLPLSGDAESYGIRFEPSVTDRPEPANAFRYAITPGYFEALGIPLRRGRLFNANDLLPAPARPVVINESMAASTFGDQDPIGRRIAFGGLPDRPWDVIIGVVGDVKQASLSADQGNAVYIIADQWLWADNPMWLVTRSTGDAASMTAALKRAIWSVDKDQPIVRVSTMEDLLAASAAQRRFALMLFEAFGIVALTLTAIGIYGVLSSGVTERMREIGIRTALGATRANILGVIVGQGVRLTAVGIVIGLAAALVASRALETLLFGVSRLDPITYVSVVALLVGVSILACWAPAWRAARIDPATTLRIE
jgi:putative ABC transport system permease protein